MAAILSRSQCVNTLRHTGRSSKEALLKNHAKCSCWEHIKVLILNSHILTRAKTTFYNKQITHWCQVTHMCVTNLWVIIGSDNGLLPVQPQAIIWNNAVLLSIGTLGAYFSEIVFQIQTFSFKKMHLKMSSGKCQPFCFVLSVLNVEQCGVWSVAKAT